MGSLNFVSAHDGNLREFKLQRGGRARESPSWEETFLPQSSRVNSEHKGGQLVVHKLVEKMRSLVRRRAGIALLYRLLIEVRIARIFTVIRFEKKKDIPTGNPLEHPNPSCKSEIWLLFDWLRWSCQVCGVPASASNFARRQQTLRHRVKRGT